MTFATFTQTDFDDRMDAKKRLEQINRVNDFISKHCLIDLGATGVYDGSNYYEDRKNKKFYQISHLNNYILLLEKEPITY
jgi:hypothetical protein